MGYQAGLFVNWSLLVIMMRSLLNFGEFKGAFPRKWVNVQSANKNIPERLWTRLVTAGGISASRTWAELSKSDLQSSGERIVLWLVSNQW